MSARGREQERKILMKKRNIFFAVMSIIVILGINVFWFYSQIWYRGGYGGTRKEELEENFLASFPQQEYEAISYAEHGNTIVYLGETVGGTGNYAIYLKSMFFDRWGRVERQPLSGNTYPNIMVMAEPMWGRIYLSLNHRRIVKAVVTEDGVSREITVDPDKPLVVITDYEIDEIYFLTENGKKIRGDCFENSAF